MNLPDKLAALEKIYEIYAGFVTSLDLACKKYCVHWIDRVQSVSAPRRFQPKITTNRLANLCAQGIEPPLDESTEWGPCPFLIDRQCPIYAVRPFGCRCLVSRNDCGIKGYADMDDFVLSVKTAVAEICSTCLGSSHPRKIDRLMKTTH